MKAIKKENHQDPVWTKRTAKLRPVFLIPLFLTLFALALSFTFLVYTHEKNDISEHEQETRRDVQSLLEDSMLRDAELLGAVMESIGNDEHLHAALARRDRALLMKMSSPLFSQLRGEFGITHFYFITPDRKVLLRVHHPDKFGDVVNRKTMLEAERTGWRTSGMELGPLGTFTYRLVTPWYDNGRLAGYVELGIEFGNTLARLRKFLDVKLIILLNKDRLQRERWESGMKMLGRSAHWDDFKDYVIGTQSNEALPPQVLDGLIKGRPSGEFLRMTADNREFSAVFMPLKEFAGETVGYLAVLSDISPHIAQTQTAIYTGTGIAVFTGSALFVFFYWYFGKISNRIEVAEEALRNMATHDEMTGLWNHRTFVRDLQDEFERAKRYGTPFALLMIDIDFFKNVNDRYGHMAGDTVLRALSDLLKEQARPIDRICRYGGEELSVILPNTTARDAFHVAERMRSSIEKHPIDVGEGRIVSITVSIGVGAYSEQAPSPEVIVKEADEALYEAKDLGRNRVCGARCVITDTDV